MGRGWGRGRGRVGLRARVGVRVGVRVREVRAYHAEAGGGPGCAVVARGLDLARVRVRG